MKKVFLRNLPSGKEMVVRKDKNALRYTSDSSEIEGDSSAYRNNLIQELFWKG